MACILNLNLRNRVSDLEKPSHPLHEPWFASLAILRGISLPRKTLWGNKYYGPIPSDQGYLGVDENSPDQAMYIFLNSRAVVNLSVLLWSPLSSGFITRFPEELKIAYTGNHTTYDQYLEFLHVHWAESQSSVGRITITPMLNNFKCISSHDGRGPMPVIKSSLTLHDAGMTSIYCIEWRSFEHRADVLSHPGWRKILKDSSGEERKVILQKWKKTEEVVSPEEDLLLFFISHGASDTNSQLVRAKLMNGKYFGWSDFQANQRPISCNIM
ncbi:hypothetical protein N7456_010850 [Penicillium angulare]|uniref:Uncharacterized protein n=1 Tax=Penicillium angulare TaxID=116970 RepID=A0A9W9ESW1_9EURO|nr:hypothetical protein N7456_010850 [Penicillium angulare]